MLINYVSYKNNLSVPVVNHCPKIVTHNTNMYFYTAVSPSPKSSKKFILGAFFSIHLKLDIYSMLAVKQAIADALYFFFFF